MANKIEFKILGDAKDLEKSLGSAQKSFDALGKASAVAFAAVGVSILGFTKLADNQRKAIAGVAQAVKSTSESAGRSLSQLTEEAKRLQSETLFGDEVILRNATQQLLTFTNIAQEQFDRTQAVALDLATVLDTMGDGTGRLKDVSIQLGKALNDPVKNLSALSRAGIQFSDDQIKVIKNLAETNRLADAQNIILTELERQYGGQARAAREADSGIKSLQNALGDLGEKIGQELLPTVQSLTSSIQSMVEQMEKNPEIAKFAAEALKLAAIVTGSIAGAWALTAAYGAISTTLTGLLPILAAVAANPVFLTGAALASIGGIAKATYDWATATATANTLLKEQEEILQASFEARGLTAEQVQADAEMRIEIIKSVADFEIAEAARVAEAKKEINTEFFTGIGEGLTDIQKKVADLNNIGKDFVMTFQTGMTKAFAGIIKGTTTAKQAFKAFGELMLDTIINYVAQWLAFQVTSKVAIAASTAFGVAQGAALAAAYAPAALAASIATFGAAAVAGTAANASAATAWVANLGAVKAAGASLAVGTPNVPQDMVANIHKGETIIPATFADAIRSGELSLSGGSGSDTGASEGSIIMDFTGASFNGITEELVQDIFEKASESIENRTLLFRSA